MAIYNVEVIYGPGFVMPILSGLVAAADPEVINSVITGAKELPQNFPFTPVEAVVESVMPIPPIRLLDPPTEAWAQAACDALDITVLGDKGALVALGAEGLQTLWRMAWAQAAQYGWGEGGATYGWTHFTKTIKAPEALTAPQRVWVLWASASASEYPLTQEALADALRRAS